MNRHTILGGVVPANSGPSDVPTLLHRLYEHAIEQPDAPAFSQVDRDLASVAELRFGALWNRVVQGADRLRSLARRGDRVLIFFEPGIQPLVPFWACLLAGIIAVPAALPSRLDPAGSADNVHRFRTLLRLAEDCCPRLLVCSRARMAEVGELSRLIEAVPAVLAVEDFWEGELVSGLDPFAGEWPDASEIAFLQYTSGSTAQPKGVVVTHGNLVHNQVGIERALRTRRGSVVLSWLPMFHDMGLVGDAMQSIWIGAHNIKLLPTDFLRRPQLWMRAVAQFRARTTGGPNFALHHAASAADRLGTTLDLSCLQALYCGSEPVRKGTVDRFLDAYRPHGLDPDVLLPCYGLAEHALVVSGWRPAGPYRVRASRSLEGQPGGGGAVVSCGAVPWDDAHVEILEPGTEIPVADGRLGEIVVHSCSVSPGYWSELGRRPARHPVAVRTLRTGDLGFLEEGQLHVEGRLKNTLVVNGRKVVAEDVEAELEAGLAVERRVRAAVVQVGGGERYDILVLLEGSSGITTERAVVAQRVMEICGGMFGFRPDVIELLRPGALPRTTSGKLQRQRAGELWQSQGLVRMGGGEES